jgi:hypothetical protein
VNLLSNYFKPPLPLPLPLMFQLKFNDLRANLAPFDRSAASAAAAAAAAASDVSKN